MRRTYDALVAVGGKTNVAVTSFHLLSLSICNSEKENDPRTKVNIDFKILEQKKLYEIHRKQIIHIAWN